MSTINLLYIEDNEMIVDIVRQYLQRSERTKFNIIHKETLRGGLEYLDSKCKDPDSYKIDAILLDLVLPNSSGVNTFKEVKKKCDFVPIIIISGHEEMAYECMKLGAQDYLIKPELSIDLLERSIRYSIERNKLKMQVEEKENRFKLLSEANFEGVVISRKGVILDVNKQFADMIQRSEDELIGKKIDTLVSPDDIDIVLNNLARNYEEPYEHMAQRKDGSLFPVEIHGRTISDGLRLTAVRDMSRYKEAEFALKQSEKKYRNLVEVTGAGIFTIDYTTGKFTYVNNVLCKQLGWSQEELLNIGPADVLVKSSMDIFIERQEAMARGEYIDNVIEYEARRKDGSTFWGLVTSEYIQDKNKNVISGNAISIDITSLKLAEEALKRKETEVFMTLENKIHEWKEEIVTRNNKKEEQLKLINSEILSLNTGEVL
ncbi:PAS domain S-box protein [Candidatus Pacearchaeota archaeon]|nr:PAS domain S-box protein [Candidatus Pacearchaeota archaeon]